MPSKKAKTQAPPEPVVEVVEVVENNEIEDSLEVKFTEVLGKLAAFRTIVKEMETEVKKLQKSAQKEIKDLTKKGKKKGKKDGAKRAPSGFAKPSPISQELCDFLGKEAGSELARTEVTKHLTTYIKEHNLQAPEDKRKILPDAKLKKLLKVPKGDEITYFNLQRYLKPHFPPKQQSSSSSA